MQEMKDLSSVGLRETGLGAATLRDNIGRKFDSHPEVTRSRKRKNKPTLCLIVNDFSSRGYHEWNEWRPIAMEAGAEIAGAGDREKCENKPTPDCSIRPMT